MRFVDIIMLISDIVCRNRQISVYLEIRTHIISCLYESVKPVWFCSNVKADRRLRNEVVRLEPASDSRRELSAFNMVAELDSVPQRKPEVRSLPMKGQIWNISEIETGIESIEEIHLKQRRVARSRA